MWTEMRCAISYSSPLKQKYIPLLCFSALPTGWTVAAMAGAGAAFWNQTAEPTTDWGRQVIQWKTATNQYWSHHAQTVISERYKHLSYFNLCYSGFFFNNSNRSIFSGIHLYLLKHLWLDFFQTTTTWSVHIWGRHPPWCFWSCPSLNIGAAEESSSVLLVPWLSSLFVSHDVDWKGHWDEDRLSVAM